jgi:PncC family amidohydrolase
VAVHGDSGAEEDDEEVMDEPQAGPGAGEAVAPGTRLRALAESIQERCVARGLTVSTAESCTGGLIAHVITEVAGSSDYFVGGIVSYSDAVKAAELGVPVDVLERHGAVSAQVAGAMASGARGRLHTDLAVAVTGIAGPGGGSDAKPVGLTYVAVADETGLDVRRFTWHGDRSANKRSSAEAALELLLGRVGEGTGR